MFAIAILAYLIFALLTYSFNHVKKSQSFTGRGSVINLAGLSPAFYALKIIFGFF
jgi:hypothetical protein